MALNFNLLRQSGPANFYEGFTQGQDEQRVNALTQQKMAQEQEMNALRRQQAELQMQQTRGTIQDQETARRNQALAQKTGMFRDRLLRAPTPEAARELVKMQYADPDVGGVLSQFGSLEQALAEVPSEPEQFGRYIQQEALGMTEWIKSQLPKTVGNFIYLPGKGEFVTPPMQPKEMTPPAMVAEYKFATSPEGGGFKGSYQDFVTAREAAKRPPAPPRGEPAAKPLTETQAIKLRTDVAKDYKSATTALAQMDDLLDSIEAVKTAPGLSAATGFSGKYLPSFPEGKAAQAETRIANLRGKVTALGKATAAMSGAIGSIANQEWKILSDQIAALDEVKGKGPLLEQINLVEQQAKRSNQIIRDAYEKTRGEDFERFPQFRDLPAPRSKGAAGGTGSIDALLEKYK